MFQSKSLMIFLIFGFMHQLTLCNPITGATDVFESSITKINDSDLDPSQKAEAVRQEAVNYTDRLIQTPDATSDPEADPEAVTEATTAKPDAATEVTTQVATGSPTEAVIEAVTEAATETVTEVTSEATPDATTA